MEVTPKQCKELLITALKADLVPMIKGSPGLGKSDIVRSIAKDFNLELVDVRLSQLDAVDMSGLPSLEGDKATFKPMNLFPLEGDRIPEGKNGFLLFLDELNSAPLSIQAASFKLILDRYVGSHKLHSKCKIVAAGNKSTDKGIVNRISTPMQSRMIHLNLEPDHNQWIEWAENNSIDYRITAFIGYRPELLFKFDPNHADDTFPCPRTWAFLSKITKSHEKLSNGLLPLLAGTVGEGTAIEFFSFCELFEKLPKYSQIVNNPTGTKIPTDEDPSQLYAVTSMISEHVDADTFGKAIKYIKRLPNEFQVLCMVGITRRQPNLKNTPEGNQWLRETALKVM